MSPAVKAMSALALLVVSAAAVLVGVQMSVAKDPQLLTPVAGRPAAPEFDLKDPNGKSVRLADFRGRPLVINFWATWCPPCRKEMPSMQRAHEIFAKEGIGLIAINVGEDADTVAQFLTDTQVAFPLPLDETSAVVMSYPVRGLPTTFVLDPEGRLAFVAAGEREWDDPALMDRIRALKLEQ
jgi:peroxiredoxin